MPILRKILFYLFVITYFTLCPLVFLYAFGYIFSPHKEEGLIKTGLISLSSVPAEATVYVENRRYTQKTPAVIQGLMPGDYSVKLTLKNHNPWQQTVAVNAGKASVLEKIILVPKKLTPRVLLADNYEDLIPLYGTRYLLLNKSSRLEDYVVYDWRTHESWPLLESDAALREFKVVSYFAVKESPFLFIHIASKAEEKFLWVELKHKDSSLRDISQFFAKGPMNVKWDAQAAHMLFIFEGNRLRRLDLNSEILYPEYAQDIRGYGIFDKMVYILTSQTNQLLRMDFEGKNQELLHDDNKSQVPIFEKSGYFDIEPVSKHVILFLGEHGELFANLLPYKFVEKALIGYALDSVTRRLIFWQKNKVGILDFSKEKTDKDIFEKAPMRAFIVEDGRNVRQAFWVYKGSHVIFLDEEKVYLAQAQEEAGANARYLLEARNRSQIFYSEEAGKLYFLDRASGNLCSLEIIPEKEIFRLGFPEINVKDREE